MLKISGQPYRASASFESISNLAFDDPQLQDELTRALAAIAQARDQDKEPVTISFAGTGERHVRIGYVVETPIWKASYRLTPDNAKPTLGHLQGWATAGGFEPLPPLSEPLPNVFAIAEEDEFPTTVAPRPSVRGGAD